MITRSAARAAARWFTCSWPRRMLTARFTSRSWSPGTYGRMPANSTPSPTARPVCSPIRRSSSAGTSRGRIRAGRGKISSRSSSTRSDVWKPPRPAWPVTRIAPGEYRPHRPGRTTHCARATSACRKVRAPVPDASADPRRGLQLDDDLVQRAPAGRADRRGDRHVLALEAARRGQCHVHGRLARRDDGEASAPAPPAPARPAGPARRARSRSTASSASSAAVARFRARGAGYQRTG